MGVESDASCEQQPNPTEATADQIQELLEAARYDDIDEIVSLKSMGISLESKDAFGRTALHMAAANGHLNIVEYLIQNGADVNVSNTEKNTPLHWACLNGQIEVIKALIQAGASVTALNSSDRTPMDEALHSGKMEVVDAIRTSEAQAEMEGISVSIE